MGPVLGHSQTEWPAVHIPQLRERLVRQPLDGREQDGVVRCPTRSGRDMKRPSAPKVEQPPLCLVHASVPCQTFQSFYDSEDLPLNDPIDERTAWSLVQAVPQRVTRQSSPTQVHHHRNPDVWLQVDPSGRWTTSGEVVGSVRDLFDLYLPLQLDPDLVIGQIGQSLDGRIATESGQSHYVTGQADIRRLHRLRALVDAVVVGSGTVAADNPRLTVREAEGQNPVRVVLDPHNRLSPDRAVFCDGEAPTLVIHAKADRSERSAGVDRLVLPANAQDGNDADDRRIRFAPATVLEALRARGLRRILVEGGGITVSRFLEAGRLTRLHVTVAPVLIGSGRPALTLPPIASLDQALRPPCRLFHLENDLLFDLDLG